MKKRSLMIMLLAVSGLMLSGCEFSIGTGTNSSPTPKTSNTSTSNSTNSNTAPAKTDKSSKPALADEKKPNGTAKTAKNNPVPDNWIYVYDDKKATDFRCPRARQASLIRSKASM